MDWQARCGAGVRRLGALGLVAVMVLPGCQGWGGQRLGPWLESAPPRYHSASPPPFPRPEPRDDGGGGGTLGGPELGRFMAFVREKQTALRRPQVPEAERRVGEAALLELLAWLHERGEEQLAREDPEEVYLRFKVARVQRYREDDARDRAVEAKLEEHWQWARERSRLLASRHFRKAGRQWLVTESPVYEGAQDALTSAVLAWAYAHTEDPDYLRKSPQEVAVYLLAKRSALATALALGNASPPRLEWVPESVEAVPVEEVLLEVAVGLLPVAGESSDLLGVVAGISILGRQLSPEERLLCAVVLLLPVLSGSLVAHALDSSRAALLTGRSLQEAQVIGRLASHLAPADADRVQRLLRQAGRGEKVSAEELQWLRELSERLREPLAEVARAVKAGARVPLLGSRTTAEGTRLVPGSPEHLAQAWVDYQFRHPGRYPRFDFTPDSKWERMYRTVLENKERGGEFEQLVLQKYGYEKNTALMLPPPGSKAEQGFIPDAVMGNPEELVWGRPYRFVEVKGRAEMSLTGNLKAMLAYVTTHGGHIEVWFRSARHSSGRTYPSGPLQKDLDRLEALGRATVRYFPD
ncbi:hypothetical protein HPC49_52250 [Pyxidicoccus fallax]|uniref:Uncharacterized protein n=1 Tax=Pyxidicoccus fallax TaxID=394095 RepID=A0A848LZ53_9BACT|nr:hypothetical protein [Pyxidicoccus fallax]NMO23488.1 hypothetical protein [Pyxidicoccus fallax]NPC86745.1 hypothetical protein [Pyxidicoccus fallax]